LRLKSMPRASVWIRSRSRAPGAACRGHSEAQRQYDRQAAQEQESFRESAGVAANTGRYVKGIALSARGGIQETSPDARRGLKPGTERGTRLYCS
jgi:hypothetical protein